MGKIYSWEDLLKGAFATKENLGFARKKSIGIMKRLFERGWIEGACIIGSVARNDYSTGSDFDAVVVYRNGFERHVQMYLQGIYRESMGKLGVEPSIILMSAQEARSGNHSIDSFLLNHIKANIRKDTTVGKNPAELIRITQGESLQSRRTQLLFYINNARRKAVAQPFNRTQNNQARYDTLGRAVDRTINCARFVLDILGKLPTKNGKPDDSKSAVVAKYREMFSSRPDAISALQKVLDANSQYKAALERAVVALKSRDKLKIAAAKKEYLAAIGVLESVIPTNRRFLEENVGIVNKALGRQLLGRKQAAAKARRFVHRKYSR